MAVRLKDLSDHLGLSVTQVSRALAGYADVSEATRSRVAEAAEQLGYRPSHAARRLRSGQAGAIGLVLPQNQPSFRSTFLMDLIAALGDSLASREVDLTVVATPAGQDEVAPYRRLVQERRVDGLVVIRSRRVDRRIEYLAQTGFPFVLYGRTEIDTPIAWADLDGAYGIRLACRRLASLGHQRIGYIGVADDFMAIQLREDGYRAEMLEQKLPWDESLVLRVGAQDEPTSDQTARLLDEGRPTAIICATEGIAAFLLRRLREFGYRPGADISVIGFGNSEVGLMTDPPLTTIEQSIAEVGETLVDFLFRRIAGEPAHGLHKVWRPRLVIRGSDVPPPPTA